MIAHLFIAVFPLAGLVLIARALFNYRKAMKATTWPTVSGKIQRSLVVESGSEDKAYKPEIVYEYQVNGRYYVGDVWRIGSEAYTAREKSEFAVAGYPPGRPVTVYYNPDEPAEAVLEPGETGWSSAFAGAVFFLIGLLALFTSE
jgi:hypothetical protein